MEAHSKWWKRAYSSLIRNKTRREISAATWIACLNWVQAEAIAIGLDGVDVDEIIEMIIKERDST